MQAKPFPYKKFLGVNNLDSEASASDNARLTTRNNMSIYLKQGTNINIDKYNKPRRRDGYEKLASGSYRNLSEGTSILLTVKDGNLIQVIPSPYSEVVLRNNIGPSDVDYTSFMGRDYFINKSNIGYVQMGIVYNIPIPDSTDVSNTYFRALPYGEFIEAWNGRLLVGVNGLVIFSEVNADYYDMRSDKSFWNIGGNLTMLKGVSDGVYVSTESKVYFVKGDDASDVKVEDISEFGAYKGSAKSVQNITVKTPDGKMHFKNAVLWASQEGVCIGGDGGQYYAYINDWYIMPQATTAAGLVIKNLGNKSDQYIVSLRN